jgi:hypothetical protein
MTNPNPMPRVRVNSEITIKRRPLIPEGRYKCEITDFEVFFMLGRHKLALHCQLLTEGITLSMICNVELDEHGNIHYPGRRSKFSKVMGLIPGTNEKLDLRHLIGMVSTALVVTSVLDEKRKPKPERDQYSTIRELFMDYSDPDEEPLPF